MAKIIKSEWEIVSKSVFMTYFESRIYLNLKKESKETNCGIILPVLDIRLNPKSHLTFMEGGEGGGLMIVNLQVLF